MQSAMPFVRLHQLTAMSSLAGAGRATEITHYFDYFGQLANVLAADKMLNWQLPEENLLSWLPLSQHPLFFQANC